MTLDEKLPRRCTTRNARNTLRQKVQSTTNWHQTGTKLSRNAEGVAGTHRLPPCVCWLLDLGSNQGPTD